MSSATADAAKCEQELALAQRTQHHAGLQLALSTAQMEVANLRVQLAEEEAIAKAGFVVIMYVINF